MPLPLVADSLDKIPESARGAYTQRDGKFHLDAEVEDTKGLKDKNSELLETNKKLKARAGLFGDRTAEELQADLDLAKQTREKKAKDEGDFETLKNLQKKEIEERDSQIFDLTARNAATEAITAAGGKPKKLTDVVLKHVKVERQNGKAVAIVVDAAGKPRIKDGQGTPVSIADLVEELKADDDYANDFTASGASGSGARSGSTSIGAGKPVIIPKEASAAEYRRLKAEAEKAGVPYKIAS